MVIFSRSRFLLFAVLASTALLLSACGGGDDEESPGGGGGDVAGTIEIFEFQDQTGNLTSPLVDAFISGERAAVKDVNDAGGVTVGGKRYNFKLVEKDSRSDPVTVVANAQQAIQDKALLAHPSGVLIQQAYEQLSPAKVITVTSSPAATVPYLQMDNPSNHPYLFSQIEVAEPIIVGWTEEVNALYPGKIKRMGFVGQDDPLGRVLESSARAGAAKVGYEWAGTVFAPAGTTDWSTFVTSLKADHPDYVYTYGGATPIELFKSSIELDLAPYLQREGFRPSEVQQVGRLGNHVIISPDWRLPFTGDYVPDKYKSAIGKIGPGRGGQAVNTGFAISQYDFIWLFKQAIDKAQTTTDTTAIAQALLGQCYDGPFGRSCTGQDHITRGAVGMITATDSEFAFYVYNDGVGDTTPDETYKFPR